jgi:hypothetical protein
VGTDVPFKQLVGTKNITTKNKMNSNNVSFDAINFHYSCVDKMIKQNHKIISQLAPLDHFLNGMLHFKLKLKEDQLQDLNSMLSDINFENYEVKLEDVCEKFLGTVLETWLIDVVKKIIKPLNKHLWKLCKTVIEDIYFEVLIKTVQKLFVETHVLAHSLLRLYNHEDRKEVLCVCYHVLRHFLYYLNYNGNTQHHDFDYLLAKVHVSDVKRYKRYKELELKRLTGSFTSHKVYYTFKAHAATLRKICDLYEEAYPDIKPSNGKISDSSYYSFKSSRKNKCKSSCEK